MGATEGFMPHPKRMLPSSLPCQVGAVDALNFKEDAHVFMLYEIFHL